MWPQSPCNCQTSCSQSQLQWDFSFSRLLPSSLQSTSFNRNDGSSQSPAARIVRLRCHSADAVARRSLAGDTDQISALGAALDRLSSLTDRLRSDFGRAARTCFAFLNALHRRLTYHAEAALTAGVGQVFREAFASEFDRVRRRSVEPLLEAGYETVANVEQTIKQFRFTATSENVARKVRSPSTHLLRFKTNKCSKNSVERPHRRTIRRTLIPIQYMLPWVHLSQPPQISPQTASRSVQSVTKRSVM